MVKYDFKKAYKLRSKRFKTVNNQPKRTKLTHIRPQLANFAYMWGGVVCMSKLTDVPTPAHTPDHTPASLPASPPYLLLPHFLLHGQPALQSLGVCVL